MFKTVPSNLMNLIKLTLVLVWLSGGRALVVPNQSTDRPQAEPGAGLESSREFDRRPLVVHYAFATAKPLAAPTDRGPENGSPEPGDSLLASTTAPAPIASSQPAQDVIQQKQQDTTLSPASDGGPSAEQGQLNSTTTAGPASEPASQSTTSSPTTSTSQTPPPPRPYCTLGEDTFQIGERWNPNLPPFGVQVCVLCECTVRPRKSCYEPYVTCRRILKECPVIDSCPDGKKPITVAGQCCKSCQSTSESNSQAQQQPIGNQSSAYESQASRGEQLQQQQQQSPFKIVYMNERTKEFMSLANHLPACPSRDSETKPAPASPSSPLANTPAPSLSLNPKSAKGGRNDLNGIDTRLAFKSLHDSAPNHFAAPSKGRYDELSKPPQQAATGPPDDHHQHPNDVQSAVASNTNNLNQQQSYGRTKAPDSSTQQQQRLAPTGQNCQLGNDTFQVGDVWNPILPPHGVQVCVQCNCIFRVRRACYETKVTCRRVNKDCPVIDTCPDGTAPVTVSGQCCKSCPTLINQPVEQQPSGVMSSAALATSTISPFLALDGIQRNERVFREFQTVSRNLRVCVRTRESVDIYNVNRYARRSSRA